LLILDGSVSVMGVCAWIGSARRSGLAPGLGLGIRAHSLVGERGGVSSPMLICLFNAIVVFIIWSFSTTILQSLAPSTFGFVSGIVKAAATCSNSFCLTLVRRFSACSNLETQSSMLRSSSIKASSCLRIEVGENCAVRGDRKYVQIRSCKLRLPDRREWWVFRRYSQRSSRARSSCDAQRILVFCRSGGGCGTRGLPLIETRRLSCKAHQILLLAQWLGA
jgi:hypothetical protein